MTRFYNYFFITFSGVPCETGMYCPAGSASPQWCDAGYYCNETKDKVPCPAGFYCPERSPSPIPCPAGSYCDFQSINPSRCPLGYYEIDGSSRTSLADTCSPCRSGYFGADEDRKVYLFKFSRLQNLHMFYLHSRIVQYVGPESSVKKLPPQTSQSQITQPPISLTHFHAPLGITAPPEQGSLSHVQLGVITLLSLPKTALPGSAYLVQPIISITLR